LLFAGTCQTLPGNPEIVNLADSLCSINPFPQFSATMYVFVAIFSSC